MKSCIQRVLNECSKPGKAGIISIMVPAAFMFFLLAVPGVYFETNDDKTIMEILTGILSTEPDAHVIYINYLLALPLSLLYRLKATIPWYGMMMLFLHGASYLTISRAMYKKCKTWIQIMIGTVLQVIFLCLQVYAFARIQYTSTAALLAIAGYVMLVLRGDEKKSCPIFILLECLALLLRKDAFLMIQPLGVSCFMGLWLVNHKTKWMKKMMLTFGILAGIYLLGEFGNAIGYGGSEWRQYGRYNRARTTLVDYVGIPSYEEVKDILDKYDVTQATYDAIIQLNTGDIPVKCLEEIAAYAEAKTPGKSIKSVIKMLIRSAFQNGDWGVPKSVTSIMLFSFLWILLRKRYRLLLAWMGIMVSHALVFGYLIYRGRMPYRVTFPLLAGEALMLMVLMILAMGDNIPNPTKCKWVRRTMSRMVCIFGLCGLLFCVGMAGYDVYRYCGKVNQDMEAYLQGTMEVFEYCKEHGSTQFLIEEDILMYASAHLLETKMMEPRNAMISHNWFSASPTMREKWSEYFKNTFLSDEARSAVKERALRVIVRVAEDYSENMLLCRLREMTRKEPVVEEEIEVSHGERYAVIRME